MGAGVGQRSSPRGGTNTPREGSLQGQGEQAPNAPPPSTLYSRLKHVPFLDLLPPLPPPLPTLHDFRPRHPRDPARGTLTPVGVRSRRSRSSTRLIFRMTPSMLGATRSASAAANNNPPPRGVLKHRTQLVSTLSPAVAGRDPRPDSFLFPSSIMGYGYLGAYMGYGFPICAKHHKDHTRFQAYIHEERKENAWESVDACLYTPVDERFRNKVFVKIYGFEEDSLGFLCCSKPIRSGLFWGTKGKLVHKAASLQEMEDEWDAKLVAVFMKAFPELQPNHHVIKVVKRAPYRPAWHSLIVAGDALY